MRRSIGTAMVLGLLVAVGACKKDNKPSAEAKTQEPASAQDTREAKTDTPPAAATASTDATAGAGVQAGGIQHDDQEGAAAVIASVSGTVEVRRVGEIAWTAAQADEKLYPGDEVRTADASTATIAVADESVIEVAEVSTVAIGSRDGTADPGSSAAVLGGLARFTVTPRAPGEGAFRVYTSSGVVLTRGTVYGVGVAANGQARVGVESGTVDVIGLAALDAAPVAVEKTSQVVIAADGTVGAPAPWPADDWGTWRDDSDAKLDIVATVDMHGDWLARLNQLLIDGYADLQATADSAATFEVTAATSAEKNDVPAYTAAQPDGAATIDASFSLGGRLEALTWAYASRAQLATDLYVRHPKECEAKWQVVGPRVDAAILWPKRYDVTAVAYLEPLRSQYYVHHPRGRAHAQLVGITVPEFYAQVDPPEIDPAVVRAKVKGAVWIAPDLSYRPSPRPIWVAAPAPSWNAKVKVAAAPPRAKVAWYVRPPALKATAIVGTNVTGAWNSKLDVRPPQPWGDLRASWKVPVGVKIKVGAPDLTAAANARAKVKLDPRGRVVWDHRASAGMAANAGADVKTKVNGKVVVRVPEVRPPAVKASVGVKVKAGGAAVRDHRDAAVKVGVGVGAKVDSAVKAGANIKVKAPQVKIKAPEVKVKAKASAGFKIGH